ncbi:unnamed protein product [Periconia digitata]|uniref:L-ornithine N(5)-monooxygenase [NAD(P)H] n=1 Tax=Periconia digitata TaxID=1303443 RepID=A0A9W4XVA1_9PLEO|nr:unnamed protein product [Periconia digitata]
MECYDLVIVGAGLYGLVSAATYHRIHPNSSILVLEAGPTLGGPWAPHRTFPGLKTNNLWGTYQIPDFPMGEKRFGVSKGDFVPAEKVYEYLCAYANENDIKRFVRVDTEVQSIEKMEPGWKLQCRSSTKHPAAAIPIPGSNPGQHKEEEGEGEDASALVITTSKLILSTGLVTTPNIPSYPQSPTFTSPILHSKSFPSHHEALSTSPTPTHTLVIGAGKSAWDIAHASATAHPASTATMLIRPSGNGPTWMAPPYVTPFRLWLEKLVFTRFLGFMSPCPWAETRGVEGVLRRFLHGTRIGRAVVGAFWTILGDDAIGLNGMGEGGDEQVKKLRPWRGAFEVGNGLSVLNYREDFFALVRAGRINVVFGEVERFEGEKTVVLKGGQSFDADAVVCATGWRRSAALFKPRALEKELGLPTDQPLDEDEAAVVNRVESEILARFPFLKTRDSSRVHHPDPSLRHAQIVDSGKQPYRLHRFLVPLSDMEDRSIGFAGAMMTLGNTFCAYLQALWLVAYFDGTVAMASAPPEQLQHETYLVTQYCALRHAMGYGNQFPDLVFDSLPYYDALMRDLGFDGKRKGTVFGMRNWGAECFRSYGPEDYIGLVDEWKRKLEVDIEGKKNV